LAIPLWNDALDRCEHVPRPTQPEIFQVREPQRERVGGIVGEDGFPGRERAVEVAGSPGVESLRGTARAPSLLPLAGALCVPTRRPVPRLPACRAAWRNSP